MEWIFQTDDIGKMSCLLYEEDFHHQSQDFHEWFLGR